MPFILKSKNHTYPVRSKKYRNNFVQHTLYEVIRGDYALSVEKGKTVQFSYIGYKTSEFVVGETGSYNVALEVDTEQLEEVVIIGYGQVKKEDATGSVIAVNSDDFNQGSNNSPQDLIVGKIAGVQITTEGGQPGSSATIRIRGGSSMSASNDPLIVIDGMPIDNREISGMSNVLSSINPADIESFTVLKDASATAIYGSRASNGVILVTTKKGKKGQDLRVNFDTKMSVGQIKETVDVLNGDEFRTLVITSYSIHYTKLYESRKRPNCGRVRLRSGVSHPANWCWHRPKDRDRPTDGRLPGFLPVS